MPSTNPDFAQASQPFAPNSVWADAIPIGTEEELTTPTGQTCRARKMSIEGMITAGILTDADALTSTVAKHSRKVKGAKNKADGTELDEMSLMKDPEAITTLVMLMDRALPHIVVSPVVKLHFTETTVGKTKVTKKISPEERAEIRENNPGQVIVFTDQIDFADKMWLFDWAAGGLGAMLTFRQ